MKIGINPLVDFAFKLMLGSPGHERVTIHFLNAILEGQVRVTHVTIRNPFVGPGHEDDKMIVLDILATDDKGRFFNIEMQSTLPAGMHQRLAFYDARLYVNQMSEGDQYHELRPAIVICVLNKPLMKHHDSLHSEFRLRDATGHTLTDDLQIHLLELTKLTVSRENVSKATPVEKWAYFLVHAKELTIDEIQALFPEPEFTEAAGVLKMISDNQQDRNYYISREKFLRDENWRIKATHDEARSEGLAEGLAEGRAEGRAEGLKTGDLIGRIKTLRELVGLSVPSQEELESLDLDELSALAESLRVQFHQQRQ